jgi:hypothetical protein
MKFPQDYLSIKDEKIGERRECCNESCTKMLLLARENVFSRKQEKKNGVVQECSSLGFLFKQNKLVIMKVLIRFL